MDERLLAYYNGELRHVREMAGEFAREFPKIAGRLGLDRDAKEICPDPYVERLLEGFAFLAARVHLKLDAEFPRLTQTLFETVYPHYLAPVPSLGVVRFEPDPREAGSEEGFLLDRGTALRSLGGDETPCQFRTAHPVRLWPLRITDARYYSRNLIELELPGRLDAKAALLIRLQTNAGKKFHEMRLEELPFFIRGSDEIPAWLYEQIFSRASHVVIQAPKGEKPFREVLPATTIKRVGFAEEQALLPPGLRSFSGYRLLKEYFACPQKFLFFALTPLGGALAQCDGERADVIITLRTAEAKLDNRVDLNTFALFCTPVINLFSKRLDPVLISDRFSEFHVVAERTRPLDYEIHSLQEVVGVSARSYEERVFEPFYRTRDGNERVGAYYTLHRIPRLLTAKEKRSGAVSSYAGSEVFIAFVDGSSAPYAGDLSQLNLLAHCTNRHLPIRLPLGAGDTDLQTELFAPVASVRFMAGPTIPIPSVSDGEMAWRLISHLSLNYLSLLDDKAEGAAALRDLLRLYMNPHDAQHLRQVDGVRSTQATPVIRRLPGDGPLTFGRGLEIKVAMDEDAFEGSGIFLLGAVLAEFFARYVSINSFTETVIISQRRGEIMRWPHQAGTRPIT
jgi:type VI secretion system protein ImpG